MILQLGSILNERYRIDGQLGKGGMGAVYLAYDLSLQIKVAVKENLNLSPESERQFRREAELLASLRHPNLPRVTHHFILEERQYLVMDYIEGQDLHTRAHQQFPSVEEVLTWSDAICAALTYLHTRQPPVIHRDIKPANIKLQPDGYIVLVDFGIAKLFDQAQTSTGARGLTPGFSPPEQYGAKRTDARSDQFSLAATIYTLLTSKTPADSIERLVKKATLVSTRSLNPAVPEHVDAALNRAMELDQDDRFTDIKSFHDALRGKVAVATILEKTLPQIIPHVPSGAETTIEGTLPQVIPQVPSPKREIVTPVVGGALPSARSRRRRLGLILGAAALGLIVVGGGTALILGGGLPGILSQATQTSNVPIAVALEASATPTIPPPTPTPSPTPSPSPTTTPTPTPNPIGGGGRIAFTSDREEGVFQIWTMNPDGSDQRQLTVDPGDKSQPRWSHDGTRLLYVTQAGQDSYGNNLGKDICIINADGSIAPVISNPGDDYDPAWSPDGMLIAFTSTRANNLRQVFVLDASCLDRSEGCTDQKPTNVSCLLAAEVGDPEFCAVEFSPAWAPLDFSPPIWLQPTHNLAVAVSINQAPGQIYFRPPTAAVPTDFDNRDIVVDVDHLKWSPDGSSIVFTWYYKHNTNEIYIAPLADRGWEPTKLTNTNGNKYPAFSPDGKYIVFTSSRDGNYEIYLIPSGGGIQENLTNSLSQDMQPDWQPLGNP